MNDPHVELLRYRFVSENPNDRFDDAKPFISSLGPFDIELNEGILEVHPQEHYSNIERAKQEFEPFLHSWESAALLNRKQFRIRSKFDQATVIDRKPSEKPQGFTRGRLAAFLEGSLTTSGKLTNIRNNNQYPAPDPSFQASPLTDAMIDRLKQYRDGRMLLTSLAYWVLTKLENEYGNRNEVSKKLHVSKRVLQTLGELSSSKDPEHGRKAKGPGPAVLSSAELQWLDAVVVRLILRVGEINLGSKPTQITMLALPKI